MRKTTLREIDSIISKNRKKANQIIFETLPSTRRKKSRSRKKSEIIALNEISVSRWQKAVKAGKIKKLGERCLYYDYS